MENVQQKRYKILALLDVITLGYYLIYQLVNLKIPFYSDFFLIRQNTLDFWGNENWAFFIYLPSVLLYLSLFLSIYCYLKQHAKTKWLVMAQLPLRVLAAVSSIPFLFMLIGIFIPIKGILVLALFIVIELAKAVMVFKQD